MVRGLSAVLAIYGATLAYFLIAPSLPALHNEDAAVFVAGACGLVALASCGLALAGAWDEPFVLIMVLTGAGTIGAAVTGVDAPALENVAKAASAAALGLLLAYVVRSAAVLVGVALLMAGIDLWSALAGPTESLLRSGPESIDALGFALPLWGTSGALEVGVVDLVFLGFYAGSASRLGLRQGLTAATMLAALVGASALAATLDRPIPALAALSVAVLVPNLDRIPRALRAEHVAG